MLSEAASAMFNEFETRCLAFDCSAGNVYARVVSENTRAGNPISVEDAEIGSIGLYKNFLVDTRNTRDFEQIDQIKLFNPWQHN
jgi:predicted nucleic acid-binding protein